MRGTKLLFATLLSLGLATPALTPALASSAKPVKGPTWQQCYDLGWVRGVHNELGELPAWQAACMAGQIPFDNGMSSAARRKPAPKRAAT